MYLQSKTGEIKHKLEWMYDLNAFWADIHRDQQDAKKFPRPENAWDKFVKLLGLIEVNHENYISSSSYHGVF